MAIPTSKIKSFPQIFDYVTYRDTAKAIKIKPETLSKYVNQTPEYFTLGQLHDMAEYLGVDGWWLIRLVERWVRERGD